MSKSSMIELEKSDAEGEISDYLDDFDEEAEYEEESMCYDSRRGAKPSIPNKTFTPMQIREIERDNAILMNKILYYNRKPPTPKFAKHLPRPPFPKVTSAEINRKREQVKINWENQILLRKIQTVKPTLKFSRK